MGRNGQVTESQLVAIALLCIGTALVLAQGISASLQADRDFRTYAVLGVVAFVLGFAAGRWSARR